MGALGETFDWPVPITMMLSLAAGITVSISGNKLLFKNADGIEIGSKTLNEREWESFRDLMSLTIFQSLPLDGIIVVTTPNELVEIIVKKAVKMAKLMNIPVLGLVENMSYLKCPDCGEEIPIFGESKIEKISQDLNIKTFSKVPVDPKISKATESGKIYEVKENFLYDIVDRIEIL